MYDLNCFYLWSSSKARNWGWKEDSQEDSNFFKGCIKIYTQEVWKLHIQRLELLFLFFFSIWIVPLILCFMFWLKRCTALAHKDYISHSVNLLSDWHKGSSCSHFWISEAEKKYSLLSDLSNCKLWAVCSAMRNAKSWEKKCPQKIKY